MTIKLPLVSIIIPTKNSAKTLEDCLVSIKNQTYQNIEIIVVDNFSSDETPRVAQKYATLFLQKWPERTTQKNYWLSHSTGEYCAFIDSDMVLEPTVIAECVESISSDEKIGGVCVGEKSVGKWYFVLLRDFERSFYAGASVESARFFRTEDVRTVGGFEEDIIFFEESLLPQKIENKLGLHCTARTNSFILHQEGDINIVSWLMKKFYYGKSLWIYHKKVKEIWIISRGNAQMSIVSRYMLLLKQKRFYTKPLLAIGVLILKTLEFWAGWIGFISSKIHQ